MSKDYRYLYGFTKNAAAVLTPEAEQAAVQPPMPQQGGMPMDPSMMGGAPAPGGMPMDPAAMGGMPPGGAPMDPSMMGGMPPQGGMPMDPAMMGGDPAAMGGMPPGGAPMGGAPMGGQIPPEILQDQMFMQFLAEALGIQMDPTSGMFIDQQGQPVPPDMLIQIYQQFQQQMMAMQQGGGAPMDPSMMGGMPPQGGMPMDPSMMGGDPAAMGGMPPGGAPMDPAAQGMGLPEEVLTQISSSVVSGVEAVLQDLTAATEKKISALMEKVETLKSAIDMLTDTTDKRTESEMDAAAQLRDDIAADLMPQQVQQMSAPAPIEMGAAKRASAQPVMPSLFDVISGNVG